MKDFIKSIFTGIMIGIAGSIYLSIDTNWIGAIFFSIGLIIICLMNYNLYTGKVGYVESYKNIPTMLKYILGNFIGVLLISFTTKANTHDLIEAKLQIPYWLLLLKSIGCGFLMFIAVDIYKQKKSIVGILCGIPAFILAGFEHSIADLFYICCSGIFNWQIIVFILIVIIGNAIGALLHKIIQ